MSAGQMDKKMDKNRINEIIEAIMRAARGDYSRKIKLSDKNDDLDSISMGLNMMVEDLRKTTVSRDTLIKEVAMRRQVEEELKYEKLLAEAANIAKSEFIGNMSHELRTPFNAILGFSEMLGDESTGKLNPQQKEYIEIIHNSGKQLFELINNLLELSMFEFEKTSLIPQMFLIKDIISLVFSLQKGKAASHNIGLAFEIEPEADIEIPIDPQKIKQAVYQLINNAIKFSPNGGEVRIKVKKNNNQIEISVRDNGIGIKKEDIPKIFREFVQLWTGLDKRYQGIGIGLTLVKKVIELHGGRVWAKSEGEGCGSTFFFTLPIK